MTKNQPKRLFWSLFVYNSLFHKYQTLNPHFQTRIFLWVFFLALLLNYFFTYYFPHLLKIFKYVPKEACGISANVMSISEVPNKAKNLDKEIVKLDMHLLGVTDKPKVSDSEWRVGDDATGINYATAYTISIWLNISLAIESISL